MAGSRRQTTVGRAVLTKTETNQKLIRFANRYAQKKWAIFPVWQVKDDGSCACGNVDCNNIGKHPIGRCVPNGFKDATTNLDRIKKWFTDFPLANIATATGEPSGIYVLDIDRDRGGLETLAQLEEAHGPLPATLISRTGGGGFHLFFEDVPGLTCTRDRIAPGIDTRGTGGYVLLPPSNHISGSNYTWEQPEG